MSSVVVGLSGGVDSAVAAWLLKEQGHEVIGVFMKNWDDDDDEFCSARQDLIDVASVADRLAIELEVVQFADDYQERVFAHFLAEYQAGRTPNPDILCNSEIKFDAFLQHALGLGADKIATGHYAGCREVDGWYQLLRAEDGHKDQSYFLYRLNQAQLARAVFPLAHLRKTEVRDLARQLGLAVADKKDSTGICFIGERPFQDFLARYLPPKTGAIVDIDSGQTLGEHRGAHFFTLGQRKGLGVGGRSDNGNDQHLPWFVVAKDMAQNIVYVGRGHHHPALFAHRTSLGTPHWCAAAAHSDWVYTAKPRYRSSDAACVLTASEPIEVVFAEPQWALTPGQSLVIYESRVCLGGGIIEHSAAL